MANYNKLWGSIVFGVIGLLAAKFALPEGLVSQEFADSLGALIGAWFGTYIAPKNATA